MRLLSIYISILLQVILAPTAFSYSCDKMIEKFIKCEASSQFIFVYKQFCNSGNSIEDADRRASMLVIDNELAENSCLAKAYKPPRYDRKAAKERRKRDNEDSD